MTSIHAVRLDTDGTLTDLLLPTGFPAQTDALREAVGGWSETAHYARSADAGGLAVAVVVNADGHARGLPDNLYATSLVSAVRRGRLPYTLSGSVVLLGAVDRAGDLTDLPEALCAVLPALVAALKSRYEPAC